MQTGTIRLLELQIGEVRDNGLQETSSYGEWCFEMSPKTVHVSGQMQELHDELDAWISGKRITTSVTRYDLGQVLMGSLLADLIHGDGHGCS